MGIRLNYISETKSTVWKRAAEARADERRKGMSAKTPDECYCIGTEKEFPDIAIEVIVTSGGVDNLEVYKRLGIKEVWFWQNDEITIYCLDQQDIYQKQNRSTILPKLDIILLASYVTASNPRLAVKEFKAKISHK